MFLLMPLVRTATHPEPVRQPRRQLHTGIVMPYQPRFARSLPAVALGSLEDEEQEAQEGRP
jgi:hypothetical protein